MLKKKKTMMVIIDPKVGCYSVFGLSKQLLTLYRSGWKTRCVCCPLLLLLGRAPFPLGLPLLLLIRSPAPCHPLIHNWIHLMMASDIRSLIGVAPPKNMLAFSAGWSLFPPLISSSAQVSPPYLSSSPCLILLSVVITFYNYIFIQ